MTRTLEEFMEGAEPGPKNSRRRSRKGLRGRKGIRSGRAGRRGDRRFVAMMVIAAVGGPGTHSVLTSHSGIPNAELFNPLHSAKTGDIFSTEVMDHTFLYRVNRIEVVNPDDISSLKVIAGEDSITLVTCTPIGVNSHRLLVHASRIADIPKDAPEQKTLAGRQTVVEFPFWAVYFIGGLLAFYLAFRLWNRRPSR
jgi:sortase A